MSKNQPLVSVICLCHNQKKFVRQSIKSVFDQSYGNIELIVVDDGSTDGSKDEIRSLLSKHEDVRFIDIRDNIGNTSAFNKGFSESNGQFIIDLAADDILLNNRIEKQVDFFQTCDDSTGVIYSDAQYINESGEILNTHFAINRYHPHEGDIYKELIRHFFIPPPTMMIKKAVFDELNGYDESLAYEDFDFWVRSSRNWKYAFQHEVLTKITKHRNSLSNFWYTKGDEQLYSTYKVCKKIRRLNRNDAEHKALLARVKFEIRQAVFSANHREAELFIRLLIELGGINWIYHFLKFLNWFQVDLSSMRKLYHSIKYGV